MYVKRNIRNKFDKISKNYNMVAVVGARQAGKTTFLKKQIENKNSSYILFDDPDARSLFEDDIKKFEKQFISSYNISVLDEIQYCKNAGIKLKYLVDSDHHLWITSSSEIILSKEILSFLVGRVSILKLFPFSFKEFLTAISQKEVTSKILNRLIWEHATYGGYPRAVLTEDIDMKKTILSDLYDTMLLKDVARTFSIEDIRTLEEFSKYLAFSIGDIVSYDKISSDLNMSFQTVKKYFDAMEKSYLIYRVLPFFTNKKKEIVKQPKLYFVDTGLRNIIAKKFDVNLDGKLFENYVLTELLKIGFSPKYWRTKTKTEVDFVIEKENNIIPIEVKIQADIGKIERSMRSFIETYKPKTAIVVTLKGKKGKTKINDCEIIYTDILNLEKQLN
ncbi:AAA family ATPase [Thermoplasmatales archaeon ex4572_165]|nr:MAG: AAA family ATPase [Thermoplasmatales archaeon ex4572_165]RLF58945.1 MAG: AAA family ATPase [Thermoplasmata archaeon]